MRRFQRPLALVLLTGLSLLLSPPTSAQETDAEANAARAAEEQATAARKAREAEFKTLLVEVLGDKADAIKVSTNLPKKPPADWQEKVDRVMATVNGAVASIFFYPLMESTETAEGITPATLGDSAALRTKIQDFATRVEAEGFPLDTSTVELSIPPVGAGADAEVELKATRGGIPLAVLWLVLGAIFFTVRMGLVQLRYFGHAIQVTRGKYDNPDDHGEVSHFQALTAALSATVGLGNIAGVAIAISIGGPGATLWMILAGFLGMASKFTECTLGQMYRQQRPDGSVMGGAMYYLSNGLKEQGKTGLGRFLAVFFAILCIGGSLAGGNSFQVNQSLNALKETIPILGDMPWLYGLVMTVAVAAVILGGLKRIAQTAEKIVPAMCGIYVAAAMFVILRNYDQVGAAFQSILDGAFSPQAGFGGMMGVLIVGFKRAAFSNEAGVGSAAIAHSAAKTEYPVREGIVALLEPFIDTIVVCTMTALVIVITGAYSPETAGGVFAPYLDNANGAGLTSQAFKQEISWFPYILSVAVMLFAFSTMISWSYYGERCWVWLFGDKSSMAYKVLFLVFVFLGSVITATQVLEFGDLMILGMAFPNVLGVVLLSGKVKGALDEYGAKMKSGEIQRVD